MLICSLAVNNWWWAFSVTEYYTWGVKSPVKLHINKRSLCEICGLNRIDQFACRRRATGTADLLACEWRGTGFSIYCVELLDNSSTRHISLITNPINWAMASADYNGPTVGCRVFVPHRLVIKRKRERYVIYRERHAKCTEVVIAGTACASRSQQRPSRIFIQNIVKKSP